jgi:DNA-binding MarR family transcriptional regulator
MPGTAPDDNGPTAAHPAAPPPLTRDLGRAERLLRAVLHRELEQAHLEFSAWTVLATLGDGPRTEDALVASLAASRVGSAGDVGTAVRRLRTDGLVGADGLGGRPESLALTPTGRAAFVAVRDRVRRRTTELYGDLPAADLEATRRTLVVIAERATAMLTPVP